MKNFIVSVIVATIALFTGSVNAQCQNIGYGQPAAQNIVVGTPALIYAGATLDVSGDFYWQVTIGDTTHDTIVSFNPCEFEMFPVVHLVTSSEVVNGLLPISQRFINVDTGNVYELQSQLGGMTAMSNNSMQNLLAVIDNWGASNGTNTTPADFDLNGTVNVADLLKVISLWNSGK